MVLNCCLGSCVYILGERVTRTFYHRRQNIRKLLPLLLDCIIWYKRESLLMFSLGLAQFCSDIMRFEICTFFIFSKYVTVLCLELYH